MFSVLNIHYTHLKNILAAHMALIKHFFTYVGGAIIMRSIGMITLPFTLYTLAPADYAKLSMINSFISIAVIFYGLGLRQALSLEYFHHTKTERINLINNLIYIYCLYALPLTGIGITLYTFINNYFFMNQLTPLIWTFILFIIFIYFFTELFFQLLQYEQQSYQYTRLQIINTLLTASITIIFLRICCFNFASSIYAQTCSMIIVTCFGLYQYRHYLFIKPIALTHSQKNILVHGLPFIPTMLCSWILSSANRWILVQHMPLNAVGIYTLSDTAVQLFQLCILTPWAGSYLPYILALYKQNESSILAVEQYNIRFMLTIMALCFAIIIGSYYILAGILQTILPTAYLEAIPHIWFALIAQIFLLGTYGLSSFIQFHKKSYFLACSLCIPALITIILNYVLIPPCGLYGCSYTAVCAYGSYFGITWWYNYRLRKRIQTIH